MILSPGWPRLTSATPPRTSSTPNAHWQEEGTEHLNLIRYWTTLITLKAISSCSVDELRVPESAEAAEPAGLRPGLEGFVVMGLSSDRPVADSTLTNRKSDNNMKACFMEKLAYQLLNVERYVTSCAFWDDLSCKILEELEKLDQISKTY